MKPFRSLCFQASGNASFKVKGNISTFGDLTFNEGPKIWFVGTKSFITIRGKVIKKGKSTITGTYVDTNNKL